MKCIKSIKKNANDIRKILLKNNHISRDYKLMTDEKYVYIPLIDEYDENQIDSIKTQYSFEVTNHNFTQSQHRARNFIDYLDNKIDPEKINDIVKSFDIIGDIVVVEIPDDLEDEKYNIAEAVLKFTKRRSVYAKKSKIQGIMRTRQFEYLAGEENLETIHKENGIRFKLDISTVYFSPRLATERERIVSQVEDGEIIIDFFAGIGSFPINIAHKKNATIYSVDINPEAYKYTKENIKLNKLKGEVIPINSDINKVIDTLPKADRILMNLPGTSKDFLDVAVNHLKKGGILNYYEFAADYETPINRVKKIAHPREIEVINKRKVKSQSPGIWHMAVDIKIN